MAVRNERPYLQRAVRSVLDQTLTDFEFIIVNDGSTDGTREVLEQFERSDDRIHLIHQGKRGLVASTNRGLDMAQGRYIARMDGDDVNHPSRFERQVRFLEENPGIGVLGTQADKIDAEGNLKEQWKRSLPTESDVAAWRLLFNICFCHPTVMMRHSLLQRLESYAEWAMGASDYELFTRAVLRTRLVNLPDTLFKHRRHKDSISVRERERYTRKCARAAASLHRAILGPLADKQIAGFLVWMERDGIGKAMRETGVEDFSLVHEYLRTLYRAYTRQFASGESNIRVLRRALRKLDTVADQVLETERWKTGAMCKLNSWSIVSPRDLISLVTRIGG